jgi:hypothetical protein
MGAALLVIPAQAGIQFLPTWMCVFSACRTKGGFARFPRASYFPFGESSQSHCARHDGFSNTMLPRSPPPAPSLLRPFLGNAKRGAAPVDGAEKDGDVVT